MKTRRVTNEKGFALIAAVATLLILSLVGGVLVSLVAKQTYSAVHQTQSLEAFDLAEAGAHRALSYLSREGGLCTDINGAAAAEFTNVAVGRGTFTVTATHYNPLETTLTSAIDDVVTTIPVLSTANFAPHGRVHIEYGPPVLDGTPSTAQCRCDIATVSHTVSGTDRLLLVGISQGNDGLESVTSVTYGGTFLTELGNRTQDGKTRMHMYYLLDPPTGTADVVVNFTTNGTGVVVGAASFTSVNQTTPLGPFVTNANNNNTASVNVTSGSNELVFDTVAAEPGISVGAGQTMLWDITQSGDDGNVGGGGSTEPGDDTVTMSWSVNDDWAIGAVSIKPMDAEAVNYMSITGTDFTLAQRGVNGTVAAAHPAGTLVSQDLCMIVSTGTVNGPSGPAQRKVEVAVEYP